MGATKSFSAAPAVNSLFGPQRRRHFERVGTISCFASECQTVILPLAHLFQSTTSIRKRLPLHVDSFVKLGTVCRCLNRAKFGLLQAADLDEAVEEHGVAFLRTYDRQGVALKFHNAFKLARQLRRDKFLMDCFPCERKHSLLKEAALPVKNTSQFERTVTARALNLH